MANAFQFRSLIGMSQPASAGEPKHILDEGPLDKAHTSTPRPNRSMQVRENLDILMRHIEHTRHDADQMMEEMAALEVDAGQTVKLQGEIGTLREELDASNREAMAQASMVETATRDAARLKGELERVRHDFEKSEREANANALDAQRIEDRLRSATKALDETRRDLEVQREAKDKAEVDAACLRANVTERDRAQNALMQKEKELRMQVAALQGQYDDASDALARKERIALEKSAELETARNHIADLEAEAHAARDEIRSLNGKYSGLKMSQDERIYSLNDELDSERESHRMIRMLLDEARAANERASEENTSLKSEARKIEQDTQRLTCELATARSQVHDYTDKLRGTHQQIASAHSDIQRLEAELEDAKKDASTWRRQANKSDELLRENAGLHDKIASMQQSLDQYRHRAPLDEAPIMLTSTHRPAPPAVNKTKPAQLAAAGQNVARIRRR